MKSNKSTIIKKVGIVVFLTAIVMIVRQALKALIEYPIKVTDSDLPYEYSIFETYVRIDKYTGEEKDVVIPDTIDSLPVKELGEADRGDKHGPFYGSNISSVYIPDSVETIANGCFARSENLEEVRLSPNTKIISSGAFYRCVALKSIEIPEGVEVIAGSAFEQCIRLENVVFPQSLREMMGDVFACCKCLECVDIPESVEAMDPDIFEGTPFEKTWDEDFFMAGKNVLLQYTNEEKVVEIPEGVEYIGFYGLENCKNMEVLILPESMREIDMVPIVAETPIKYIVVKNEDMIFPDWSITHDDVEFYMVAQEGSTAEAYAAERSYITFLETIPEDVKEQYGIE